MKANRVPILTDRDQAFLEDSGWQFLHKWTAIDRRHVFAARSEVQRLRVDMYFNIGMPDTCGAGFWISADEMREHPERFVRAAMAAAAEIHLRRRG